MEQSIEDFVQKIRLSTTIREEADIVTCEQSLMRSYLNNNPNTLYLPRVIAKAIFLDTIGYNVSYAQIPSIQLMSNDVFSYKRIGYIATSILLNQSSQMTVLVTQILINDLNSKNKMIQKLALGFIANLCVPEVCRAVAGDVNKLLKEKDYDLLKRAGMAIVGIVRLNPDLANNYKNLVQPLLNSNNHGIVNAGINLVLEILKIDKKLKKSWASFHVPFTKILSNLTSNRINREFIKNGFNDPFMQIKVLKVLEMLGKNSPELENILQTLVSSLSTTKNSGRAILFQTVETICAVSTKASLIGLAFNQIGRLLSMKSPSIIYSSLSVLSRILCSGHKSFQKGGADSMALQRYKEKITQCLDNKDPSIRIRALDVIISLIDKDNVDKLIPEVMLYIKLAESDFRRELVTKVYSSVQEFSPNNKWHFETVFQILVDNGNYFSSEILTSFCNFISETPEIIPFAIQQFSNALVNYINNQSLMKISAFVIGEFSIDVEAFDSLVRVSQMPQTQNDTLDYIITAIAKLSTRVDKKETAFQILHNFSSNNDFEIQQRSGELMKLLLHTDICEEMLAPIQDVYEIQQELSKQKTSTEETTNSNVDDLLNLVANESIIESSNNRKQTTSSLLDELYSLEQINSTSNNQSSLTSNNIQEKESTSSSTEYQKPTFLLQNDNYIVYGLGKRNPQNPKQIALQLQIYGKTNHQLTNFKLAFKESPGWRINVTAPSSNLLLSKGNSPISQVIYLLDADGSPFSIQVNFSYLYGSQPMNETSTISTLPPM